MIRLRTCSQVWFVSAALALSACEDATSDADDAGLGGGAARDGGAFVSRDGGGLGGGAVPAGDAAASQPGASDGGARDAGAGDASAAEGDAGRDGGTSAAAGALAGWKLVWNDEFDGAPGAKLDPARWVYETGGSGWGNNQLEYDTDRADNASLDGKGELVITAKKESYMGKSYTSARLKTQGKFEHSYGRYESRMKIPFGQGMWPAFWMLGADIGSVSWPTCGEIDIMENIGKEPGTVHGTVHGPGYSGGSGIGAPNALAGGARFADDYHVFAIEWEKDVVRWYVDGNLYQTRTPKDLPSGARWVYDHPFFILLNLAVGGQWPGNPDGATTFPQTLRVDYVRVYDRG